jgi:hypothetical protein
LEVSAYLRATNMDGASALAEKIRATIEQEFKSKSAKSVISTCNNKSY